MALSESLIGLIAEQANGGLGEVGKLQNLVASTNATCIHPDLRELWNAMADALARGEPPTLRWLQRKFRERPASFWGAFARAADAEGSIETVRAALTLEARRSELRDALDRSSALLRVGKVHEAEGVLSNVVSKSVLSVRATAARDIRFDSMFTTPANAPVVTLPFPKINEALGKGWHISGNTHGLLVAAYTNVGKSTLAYQIGTAALEQGHELLYFLGETTAENALYEMARLRGRITKKGQWENRNIFERERGFFAAKPLYLFDGLFDPAVVMALASGYSFTNRKKRESGELPPNSRLIVVVDNVDHAIDLGAERQWQGLDNAVRLMAAHAKQNDYGLLLLAQATPESYQNVRPPMTFDLARSKAIASHIGNFIGAIRPVYGEADVPHALSVRKAKLGFAQTVTCRLNEYGGFWEEGV
jgi:hypothetical protein